MRFETWEEAYEYQKSCIVEDYGNEMFDVYIDSFNELIDYIPFSVGEVVWVILAEGYEFGDESATVYGVNEKGKWCGVFDTHCSCYGWEATPEQITEYDSLEQLLEADKKSIVIVKNFKDIVEVYPFIKSNE